MASHHGTVITPKILLAAHLDEVGLLVRGILPNGYLKVVPLGGWWAPALLGQQVLIRSKQGDRLGVIGSKPPHYMGEEERNRPLKINDLYIDIGASSGTEVASLGVEVGNPVVPAVKATAMSPQSAIVGKAFDDRAGCTVLLQVLRELDHTHPNLVIGAGTVQEESGIKGARTIAAIAKPDLCVVLEGAPADDFPDAGGIVQGRMGGGPQIRYYDPSMIANRALVDFVVCEAQKFGISYQLAVREGGGTDGSEIQLAAGGVPTVVIGVPVRYAHSHYGILNLKDVEATVQLVKAMIQRLDEAKVNELKTNPW